MLAVENLKWLRPGARMTDVCNFSESAEALRGKNVLVVEDNGLLSCVLEEALREAGCEVVGPYARVTDAMAAAATERIDVALLDLNLRGELVSPVADRLRERGVPFVVSSALQAEALPRALQSATQLRKPYTDADLLDRLASLIDSPRRDS